MPLHPDTNDFDVNQISEASFVEGWALITGSKPAAVLADRREMIAMLLDDVAVLPVFQQRRKHKPISVRIERSR